MATTQDDLSGHLMNQVLIRPCANQDLESIFQLDRSWDEEGVAYYFSDDSREHFIAEFERFPEYFLVAEKNSQIIGYVNGSVLVNEKVEDFRRRRRIWKSRIFTCGPSSETSTWAEH